MLCCNVYNAYIQVQEELLRTIVGFENVVMTKVYFSLIILNNLE